jgi:hypothetical protein
MPPKSVSFNNKSRSKSPNNNGKGLRNRGNANKSKNENGKATLIDAETNTIVQAKIKEITPDTYTPEKARDKALSIAKEEGTSTFNIYPSIANILASCIVVLFSYLMQRNFSFK